jgi:hypothetical protein
MSLEFQSVEDGPNGPYLRGLGEHRRAQIWPKWSERNEARAPTGFQGAKRG